MTNTFLQPCDSRHLGYYQNVNGCLTEAGFYFSFLKQVLFIKWEIILRFCWGRMILHRFTMKLDVSKASNWNLCFLCAIIRDKANKVCLIWGFLKAVVLIIRWLRVLNLKSHVGGPCNQLVLLQSPCFLTIKSCMVNSGFPKLWYVNRDNKYSCWALPSKIDISCQWQLQCLEITI